MSHPTDVDLAALVDGALPEHVAAATRAHLQTCADCRQREAALVMAAARVAELPSPQPAIAASVLDAIERAEERSAFHWLRPAALVGAGAAAGVAAMLLVAPSMTTMMPVTDVPSLTARGQPTGGAIASGVKLRAEVLTTDGWRALEGQSSVVADHGRPSLRVAVDVLAPPSAPSFVIAYARDAEGAVTWLRPTWTDAARIPSAEPAPTTVGPGMTPLHVTLEEPVKVLEVTVAELSAPVSLDLIDHHLERGGDLDDGPAAVRWSSTHWLRVRADASEPASTP